MKREILNSYIGREVRIVLNDGHEINGILQYTSKFCAAQGWRKPGYYNVGQYCFKCSHIKKFVAHSQI